MLEALLKYLWAVPATITLWTMYVLARFGPSRLLYYIKQLILHVFFIIASAYGFLLIVVNPFRDRTNLLSTAAHFYASVVGKLIGVKIDLKGAGHLEHRPCIYMVNHQSTLDVLCVSSIIPDHTVAVAKRSLFYIPVFGWFLAFSRNIFIERANLASAKQAMGSAAQQMIKDNVGVLIFPEGTRSRSSGELLPFKKGGFHLAIDAQVPIVPIVIANQKHIYDSRAKKFNPGTIRIKALAPIPTKGMTKDDVNKLLENVQSLMQEEVRLLE